MRTTQRIILIPPAESWDLQFMTGLDFHVLSFPYLPTLVSSNAPKARSEAFCASESP